jgi:hypothetical protein
LMNRSCLHTFIYIDIQLNKFNDSSIQLLATYANWYTHLAGSMERNLSPGCLKLFSFAITICNGVTRM